MMRNFITNLSANLFATVLGIAICTPTAIWTHLIPSTYRGYLRELLQNPLAFFYLDLGISKCFRRATKFLLLGRVRIMHDINQNPLVQLFFSPPKSLLFRNLTAGVL
jgi:hypothetical protein